MNIWLALFLAGLACFFIFFVVVVGTWVIATAFYFPLIPGSYGNRYLIGYTAWSLLGHLVSALWIFPGALWSASLSFLALLRENLCYLFILGIVCTGGYIWVEKHDAIVQGYIFVRQTFLRPVIDFFLLPVINCLRMIFNTIIAPINWWVNLYAFYQYGLPITLFKCGVSTDLTNLLYYGANAIYAIFIDFSTFLSQDYFHASWNIMNSLEAIGILIDSFVPIFSCLCFALNFVYIYISIFVNLISLHNCINYIWNFVLSIIQLGFNFIMDLPSYPNFDNITLNACGAVESAGDTFEDFVYLTGETGWGVLTTLPTLPVVIGQVLAVPYTSVITHPICGLFRVINMTAVVTIHIPEVFDSSGSGVKFFQFGNTADELRAASLAFGSFFAIFNTDTQAFVSQFLLSVVALLAFVFEWGPGNIFYFFFGGELPATWGNRPAIDGGPYTPPNGFFSNFLRFYFTDYYLKAPPLGVPVTIGGYTYSSSLDQFFREVFLTDQALANLLGLINDPFGQVVRYTFDILFAVVKAATNFVSFLYCIFTFQCDNMPITFRNVDFDVGFNQFYYLAGAMGDVVRQFDPNGCVLDPVNENHKNIICCTGNLIETGIDSVVIAVQSVTHFVQDLLTLPTFTVHLCIFGLYTPTNKEQCVRIPNFELALYQWKTAICEFSCALTSLIPSLGNFQCQFPPPPTPAPGESPQPPIECGKVQSCMGNELCSILQIGILPFEIMNALFVKTLNGQAFVGFAEFLQFSFLLILGQFAQILSNFGLMLDCTICAFVGGNTNCAYPIYTVLYELGQLLIAVAVIFTEILLEFAKLLLALTIGLFGGGNPIEAFITFIVGVLNTIFGGIGTTVIKILIDLFDAVGLGFIGQFINILWQGLCPLLNILMNIFITILNMLTFGAFGIKKSDFCCSGGNCTISGGNKRGENENLFEGTLFTNSSTWLKDLLPHYNWPSGSPCNSSMAILAEMDWNYLRSDQMGEIVFCLFKDQWKNRTDNQTDLGNSTCDEIITENLETDWRSFTVFERGAVRDCIYSRLMTDTLRIATNQTWIPQDILTNSWRKYYFALEMGRGYLINWQFMNDQQNPSEVILSGDYSKYWESFGLSVIHYKDLKTADDIVRMREEFRLKDYFRVNHATQYDAVLYTASGAWGMITKVLQSLKTTMTALSDNQTNPVVFLSYNYSFDNAIPVAGTSVLSIISKVFTLINNFTSYWSDQNNYRKRSAAYEHAKLGLDIAYQESRRQLRLMGEEFFHDTLYVQQLRANQCGVNNDQTCDPSEREKYHKDFKDSIQGLDEYKGETSVIYKLSQWWKNAKFQTYTIKNPRYGTNRPSYNAPPMNLQYLHENGTMVNESLNGRFWRYVSLVNKGTPAAQRRWDVMWQFGERVKNHFYKEVLSQYYNPEVIAKNKRAEEMYAKKYEQQRLLYDRKPSYHNTHEILCDDQNRCEVRVIQKPNIETPGPITQPPTSSPPPPAATSHKRYEPFSTHAINERRKQYSIQELDENPFTLDRSPEFMSLLYRTADLFTIECYTHITIPCFPPLVCNGSTTTICEQCLYLDQLIGRATAATNQLINHYTGGPFTYSMNETYQFFQYTFDPNARVIVGGSPDLNVNEFPYRLGNIFEGEFPNSVWMGDDTPNKLRFNDITAMINSALNATNTTLENITLGDTALSLIDEIDIFFITTFISWADTLFQKIYFVFTSGTAFAAGESVLVFILDMFVLCDWMIGNDYSGVNKRFSIGEMVLIFLVGTFSIVFITSSVFGYNLCSLITGTSLSLIIFASLFLTLYSNWSFLCAPGLPVILMNDIMYFLAYNLFPKCSYFWGFLIRSGYTNDRCYFYNNDWQFYNCRRDLGFHSIIDNIVLFVHEYFPEVLQWIRDTRTPIYIIYQIPWVNQKLNQFVGVDMNDPAMGATYRGCSGIVTLLPYILNSRLALLLFSVFLAPVIAFLSIALSWFLNAWWYMFIFLYYILTDFIMIIGSTPYDRTEDVVDDDNDMTSLPTSRISSGLKNIGSRKNDDDDDDDDDSDSDSDKYKKKKKKRKVKPAVMMTKKNATYTYISNIITRTIDNWVGDRKKK
jgi:hypothetical protein